MAGTKAIEISQEFKYYAFISYNSKDIEWGKRLQRKLEHYKMPATLCSEYGWQRRPIKPVFFAATDIQPGELTTELKERLQASRNLIVICSPNSAKSEWVGKEIEYFHQIGRTKQIYFFIIDGQPHSGNIETECFNPIINSLGLPEILGANIHEKIYRWSWMNKERAYVQLISKLLGVEFDAIWQRHKRLLLRNVVAWMFGALFVALSMFGFWHVNQPVDINVTLKETTAYNQNIPALEDAVMSIVLDNETKLDTIHTLEDVAIFRNIPHYMLNNQIRLKVECKDFIPLDTILRLKKNIELGLNRNPKVYGDIHFRIWDFQRERGVGNVEVEIEGQKVMADNEGKIRMYIPLEKQKTQYIVKSTIPLVNDTIYMPCEDGILEIR